jgi:acyl-CoA synthetase (AMP-forming)/AMP-acid ligase II
MDGSLGDVQTVDEFIKEAEGNADRPCLDQTWTPVNPAVDVAYLVYSSGTTGYPKAVMISHRNVVAAVILQAAVDKMHVQWDRDRTLAVLPVYDIYGTDIFCFIRTETDWLLGLICLLHLPIWLGISTIFMGKFELGTFCHLIEEYAITHTYVAPPIVLHLAKSPLVDQHDINSLRMMTSGGAPLSTALINELFQRRGLAVRQAYGLLETTSVSHIQAGISNPACKLVLMILQSAGMLGQAESDRTVNYSQTWRPGWCGRTALRPSGKRKGNFGSVVRRSSKVF